MLNKRFVTTSTNINTNSDLVLDTEIIKTTSSPIGNTDSRYYYPTEIQIINDCGAGIEWQILSSYEEFVEYSGSPASFTFVRLPKDNTLQENFNSLSRCYKFVLRGYEVTALSDLTLEFINYKPSLK